VEQVLPPQVHPFRNPYGDGQFKVTVTNHGEKPATVPALLTDGQTILWQDSLVILDVSTVANDGRPCLLAGAGKVSTVSTVQSVVLKPKESLSTTVDVLTANGVFFQRGGARYYYRFCLGEKSTLNYFYYQSDHHEPLRDAALKKLR
jgi:hypothetical protein